MTAGKKSAHDGSTALPAPSRQYKHSDKASDGLLGVCTSVMQAVDVDYNPRCCSCNALSALHHPVPALQTSKGEPADMRSPLSFEGGHWLVSYKSLKNTRQDLD